MTPVPGADAVVAMLQLHGVKRLFGLCGDTRLPSYDVLSRLDHGFTHILTRDERSAAVEDLLKLRRTLAEALAHDRPALVDVISQPLHEAKAPVSKRVV